jgi:hypothetical protein
MLSSIFRAKNFEAIFSAPKIMPQHFRAQKL